MLTLVSICVYVTCVAVPMEARGTGSSGVGVTGSCEPADVGAENWTLALLEDQNRLLTTEPSLQPLSKYLTLVFMFPMSIYLSCEDPWSDCLHLEERKGNTFMAEQDFISRSQCKQRHTLQFHHELKSPGQEAIDIKFWSRASWHLEKTRPWLWSLSM